MKLNCNIGWLDKLVRYGISVIIFSLHLTGTITGMAGILSLILAGILLATGIFRFCPIYSALGLSTCKPGDKAPGKY